MEKQKRWQLYLIIAVLVLTLYNILPTLFYYSKPLKSSVDDQRAKNISYEIIDRVNQTETDSINWLHSFSKLIGVKPIEIRSVPTNAGLIQIDFKNQDDAALFKRLLPRAGALIPFVPEQLELSPELLNEAPTSVLVQRNISLRLDPAEVDQLFQFTTKYDQNSQLAPLYKNIVYDRTAQMAAAIAGPSLQAQQVSFFINENSNGQYDDEAINLTKEITEMDSLFGKTNPITKRYYASFSQFDTKDQKEFISKFITKLDALNKKLKEQQESIKKAQATAKEKGAFADSEKDQELAVLNRKIQALDSALAILRKNTADFEKGKKPLSEEQVLSLLNKGSIKEKVQKVDLQGFDPYIESLTINWENSQVAIRLYEDIQKIRFQESKGEKEAFVKSRINQHVINTIARLSRTTDETFKPIDDAFVLNIDNLSDAQSYLLFNLGYIAQKRAGQVTDQLLLSWVPQATDLLRESYPIRSYDEYKTLPPEEKRLGLVVYAPAVYKETPPTGFRNSSIYVIARGMANIVEKYKEAPEAAENQTLVSDFNQLNANLNQLGFIGYPAASFDFDKEFKNDYIFELNDYYSNLLKSTRENFLVKGSKHAAVLDFSNVEQRILNNNRIDDQIQEDLVKWKEAYNASQVDLNVASHYTVPAPTKNVYLANLKLSAIKYFRGDDRKILKWGLDLSGGKTVRIALFDQNNRRVTDPDDLKQAVNELYTRINKMGVAERTIRIENDNIMLDFPGSQGLSASELIKASAMYFHVANEKFSPNNQLLAPTVNQFLQEVWNEAVVTNRKDAESINEIAWKHLGGDEENLEMMLPRSESAKILYEQGLRLANPSERAMSQAFDDTLSAIGVYRGDEPSQWARQTHPLVVIFHNYALEGSNLENIQAGYDSSEGNVLVFGVKSGARDDFYTWTSQFAEDMIVGTPKEALSRGNGWRMAVILNGSIITSPTLNAALRDGGRISGRFSQREVNQLAADLKAGSLSFTPRILSEENVSPELGKEERIKGMVASLVAIILVVVAMVGYYRFAGLVASIAVILNIFIMWGVLQNLGAALTLPGIAGIVLTIGMAVDANVLVFERVREEYKISGRIASAIQAGYRKAFSAIFDSNITTIIAAFILIQFDSGPIKGFAVVLIIGILSSMFTALFMTRYFFAGWVRDPNHKHLTMARFLKETHFDFLAQAKKAIIISLVMMIVGMGLLFKERHTIFGMDFTGGYSLTLNVEEKPNHPNYRLEAINAFLDQGASSRDIEVRELSRPNQLRIQLGTSMNEQGHPFYQMPEVLPNDTYAYAYQQDPRLDWVVNALESHSLKISPNELSNLNKNWTTMSGQLSDTMRNNAIWALAAALVAILAYITFRFEFKYAIGAVAGLIHDVIITVGILSLFHALGFAVQIDLQVIGAIMTIIGYSLNDTIIVFDRIREDLKIFKKMSFREVINHSLNVTLSRTIMTSGTTILVLLALVLLGGQAIFSFSLVMTIGVIIGTLSSLFIASPVMLYFHNREVAQESGSGNGGRESLTKS